MITAGISNSAAIIKKQSPLKSNCFTEYGYNELKMAAPNNVHSVSNVATAANNEPEV